MPNSGPWSATCLREVMGKSGKLGSAAPRAEAVRHRQRRRSRGLRAEADRPPGRPGGGQGAARRNPELQAGRFAGRCGGGEAEALVRGARYNFQRRARRCPRGHRHRGPDCQARRGRDHRAGSRRRDHAAGPRQGAARSVSRSKGDADAFRDSDRTHLVNQAARRSAGGLDPRSAGRRLGLASPRLRPARLRRGRDGHGRDGLRRGRMVPGQVTRRSTP